jgi:hypothetical protein
VRDDLFLLLGYLLTSARGLADEPKGYGPFRLLDAAGRLLEIMEEHEMGDDFTKRALEQIDKVRFGPDDDERLLELADQLSQEFAEYLKAKGSAT